MTEQNEWLEEQRNIAHNILSMPDGEDRSALWWTASDVSEFLAIIDALDAQLTITDEKVEKAVVKWCNSGKSGGVTISTLIRSVLLAAGMKEKKNGHQPNGSSH